VDRQAVSTVVGLQRPQIPHLQRAIAIDLQFAMPPANLGFFYWNIGQTGVRVEYVLNAYVLSDRISDQERLFILFLYDRRSRPAIQRQDCNCCDCFGLTSQQTNW
jgi:hypothetical protein